MECINIISRKAFGQRSARGGNILSFLSPYDHARESLYTAQKARKRGNIHIWTHPCCTVEVAICGQFTSMKGGPPHPKIVEIKSFVSRKDCFLYLGRVFLNHQRAFILSSCSEQALILSFCHLPFLSVYDHARESLYTAQKARKRGNIHI